MLAKILILISILTKFFIIILILKQHHNLMYNDYVHMYVYT
jgi:hypothetical protein